MRVFHLARRPPQWLRVALAGLLLAFALNTIAHVSHQHEATAATNAHSLACGYCVSFGGLADGPVHAGPVIYADRAVATVVLNYIQFFSRRTPTSSRPRAPPAVA